MIIKIDWPHDVIDSIPAINLVEILTRLVISDAYGHNLVVISRGLAEAFLSRLSLGEYVSANLRTIKEQYAERGSYVTGDRFPILNVTRDQDRKLEKLSDRNFQIGYKELLGSRLLDKPILLLEGPKSDGIVFDAIINSILKLNKIGKLSYEKRSGGGDTTLEVLKGLIADRHVIACICDSDRLTPTCSLGGTANKIQKNLHLLPTAILTFLVTPTREVENFVPFEVARHLIVDPHDKPKIVKLGHLIDAQGIVGIEDCIWSFYDIKKGIDAKKITKSSRSKTSKQWIVNKYSVDELSHIQYNMFPVWGDSFIINLENNGELMRSFIGMMQNREYLDSYIDWFMKFMPYFIASEVRRA